MSKAPDSPADSQQARAPRDAEWHDLVAAVMAVKGSPPVRPPAAMLTGLERKLGFAVEPTVWWQVPRFLGGAAAALALIAGGLAWRAGAPNAGLASTESRSVIGERLALKPGPRENEESLRAPKSSPTHAPDARLAPGEQFASGASSRPGQNILGGPTQSSSGDAHRPSRNGSPAAVPSHNGETLAMHDASFREGDDPIDLKSDFYVVGIIAAALQNPITANPYEASREPVEWSDWLSGYELGRQLPPKKALALGESWTWEDPENLSLAIGITEEEIATTTLPASGPKALPDSVTGAAAEQGQRGQAEVGTPPLVDSWPNPPSDSSGQSE